MAAAITAAEEEIEVAIFEKSAVVVVCQWGMGLEWKVATKEHSGITKEEAFRIMVDKIIGMLMQISKGLFVKSEKQ